MDAGGQEESTWRELSHSQGTVVRETGSIPGKGEEREEVPRPLHTLHRYFKHIVHNRNTQCRLSI